MSVEQASPADVAGVHVGDVVAKVDGRTQHWQPGNSLAALQQVMQGPPGSQVALLLCRWQRDAGTSAREGSSSQQFGEWSAWDVVIQRPAASIARAAHGGAATRSIAGVQGMPTGLVREDALSMLTTMGFGANTSMRALLATGNDVDAAVDWIAAGEARGEDLERPLPEHAEALSAAEAAAIEENGGRVIVDGCSNPVEQLMALGFERSQVEKALRSTQGRIMMAADLLFEQQAKELERRRRQRLRERQGSGGFMSLFGFGGGEVIS